MSNRIESKKRIFVIDDEKDIRSLLKRLLEREGHSVSGFGNGKDAKAAIAQSPPDLCVVDVGLPDINGLSLVRELSDRESLGVIILSVCGALSDKVLGLQIGADDYISKPFEPTELVARVNCVLRRSKTPGITINVEQPSKARFDNWVFDLGLLQLTCDDGRKASLTASESRLLQKLMRSANRVLTREQLKSCDDFSDDLSFERSIDVQVSRIRKKIDSDPKQSKYIKTIYGAGYIFSCDVTWLD